MSRLRTVIGERSNIHQRLVEYRNEHLVDADGNLKEPTFPQGYAKLLKKQQQQQQQKAAQTEENTSTQ